MTDSTAIDVAIGLVFTYFLFAMFCSGINELIARILNLRGKLLGSAITGVLGSAADDFWNHGLVKPLTASHNNAIAAAAVAGAGDATAKAGKAPSYISSTTFARVVIDLIKDPDAGAAAGTLEADIGTIPGSPALQDTLSSLYKHAAGDLERFSASIEQWFNDWMDRLSGLYKRQSQRVLVLLALAITLAFNVNTLLIAGSLWREPTVRSAIVQAAQGANQQTPPALKSVYTQINDQQKIGLPIGWTGPKSPFGKDFATWLWAIVGWIISAAALTLGAPFWFDLLGRLNSLRSTGPPPGSATAAAAA